MVQLTLPRNSVVKKGKRWSALSGAKAVRTFRVYLTGAVRAPGPVGNRGRVRPDRLKRAALRSMIRVEGCPWARSNCVGRWSW